MLLLLLLSPWGRVLVRELQTGVDWKGLKAHLLSAPCHGTPSTRPGCSGAQGKKKKNEEEEEQEETHNWLSLSSLAFTHFSSFQVLFPCEVGAARSLLSPTGRLSSPLCSLPTASVLNSGAAGGDRPEGSTSTTLKWRDLRVSLSPVSRCSGRCWKDGATSSPGWALWGHSETRARPLPRQPDRAHSSPCSAAGERCQLCSLCSTYLQRHAWHVPEVYMGVNGDKGDRTCKAGLAMDCSHPRLVAQGAAACQGCPWSTAKAPSPLEPS